MSRARACARLGAIAIALLLSGSGCASTEEEEAVGEDVGEANEAYTGRVAEMKRIGRSYPGAPASWAQPDSDGTFDEKGYCGATAAANLLRWYQKDVSPDQAIADGCWSVIGTRPATLARYLQKHHASLGCALHKMDRDADALAGVRASLRAGKPLVVLFMTGYLNAHWVTIMAVEGRGPDPNLVVMSWAGFYRIKWSEFQAPWRAAYSGPYPHIQCSARSPLADKIRVDG
jgi:hypothetical protein